MGVCNFECSQKIIDLIMLFGLEGLVKLYVFIVVKYRDEIMSSDNKNQYIRYELIPMIFESIENLIGVLSEFNKHLDSNEALCFLLNN